MTAYRQETWNGSTHFIFTIRNVELTQARVERDNCQMHLEGELSRWPITPAVQKEISYWQDKLKDAQAKLTAMRIADKVKE